MGIFEDKQSVYSLVEDITPLVIGDKATCLNCFRSFIIRLPESTDKNSLLLEVQKIPQINFLWKLTEIDPNQVPIELGDERDLFLDVGEADFFLAFRNRKKYFWSPNWSQLTFVVYREFSPSQKFLIISSTFTRPQLVERGVLTDNCLAVIEVLKEYFGQQEIDIARNISEARLYIDPISKIERPVSVKQIFMVVALFIFILLLLFGFFIGRRY